jgi:hypothetical protein
MPVYRLFTQFFNSFNGLRNPASQKIPAYSRLSRFTENPLPFSRKHAKPPHREDRPMPRPQLTVHRVPSYDKWLEKVHDYIQIHTRQSHKQLYYFNYTKAYNLNWRPIYAARQAVAEHNRITGANYPPMIWHE